MVPSNYTSFVCFCLRRKEVMIFDKHLPLSFIESKIISRFFTILHPSFTLTSFHHPFIRHPSFGFCTFQTLTLARATPQGFSTEGSNQFGIQLAIVLTMCASVLENSQQPIFTQKGVESRPELTKPMAFPVKSQKKLRILLSCASSDGQKLWASE